MKVLFNVSAASSPMARASAELRQVCNKAETQSKEFAKVTWRKTSIKRFEGNVPLYEGSADFKNEIAAMIKDSTRPG